YLHPYVKHRIFLGETKGILPRNMYKSVDIIDEGIAKLYLNGYNIDADVLKVKIDLFKIVDAELEDLLKKEAFHQTTVSTNKILKEELDRLREDFTMDADLDLILNTELDDISYKQRLDDHVYIYSDLEIETMKSNGLDEIALNDAQLAFKKIYSILPMTVSNIVDMHNFGKLSIEEIAEIRHLERARIKRIIDAVKRRFQDYL
ncbi:MAG: hypothetical protein KJN68_07750, partial [Bacteroidia bacterium]|nr:hypothetical protein [Bacteroidia bacterium]